MGRVDEAMRRAAEAGARRTLDLIPDVDQSHGSSSASDGQTSVEAFPSEQGERPRLRPVGPPVEMPMRTPADSAPPPATRMLPDRLDPSLEHKVVVDEAMDPASREQYRRLATGLHAAQAESGLKVVMLVSALAGEGKTLTASNLALTFSESYQRSVLLIDGDLRRPSLHTVFSLDNSPGLSEGLLAPQDRKLPLHRVSSRLTVLTAGTATDDPMAALASERMQRLIEQARETFDWVIVDTPPIGLLSDANLLAAFADGAILVVKAEATPCDLVQRAVTAIGKDRLLGVVLNRASVPMGPGYAYRRYYESVRTPGA
ncbi:MAG: CpsD/CapB family tyrosine-protein kinase [Acidobacteriota bacterium]